MGVGGYRGKKWVSFAFEIEIDRVIMSKRWVAFPRFLRTKGLALIFFPKPFPTRWSNAAREVALNLSTVGRW